MTIATQRSTLYRTLLLLGVVSLVACGGGGGSGGGGGTTPNNSSKAESSLSSNVASSVLSSVASSIVATSSSSVPVVDTTPAVFNFAPSVDVALSTTITSPAITLSGFDVAVPISITNGEYSINGGAFTSAAGTISPAQTLAVKVTSSNANSTAVTTTLTVGGVSATYTVTTLADAIPEAFSFTPATNVVPNSDSLSNAITVSGIEVATAISITGGEYSINGGAFTSAAGTVANGQTVAVKAVAPATTETTQEVAVTIGGVSGIYSVTTVPDTTPPVAEFKFPTPYTMSEAMSVKVRGTATDENVISSVKVVVRSFDLATPDVTISSTEIAATPKAEGDYSSWTVDVPLTANAENEIKVVAMDDRDNETVIDDANKVVIRQADVKSAFPDEDNQFERLEFSALDSDRNRILISNDRRIFAVDISTGKRTIFSDHQSVCNDFVRGLTLDTQGSRLYGVCNNYPDRVLLEFSLLDGTLMGEYAISPNPMLNIFYGLSLDRFNGRNRLVLVERGSGARIMSFGLDSKEFTVISPRDVDQPVIDSFGGIALDGDSYWVTSGGQHSDAARHKVIKVDAITGKREVFADNSTGSGELFSALLANDETAFLTGIVKDTQHNRFIIMESISSKLISVDIDTGVRSLFKDVSYNSTDNLVISYDMDLDETNGVLLVSDMRRRSLIMVDLETREKIILSKSENDY